MKGVVVCINDRKGKMKQERRERERDWARDRENL